MSGIYTIPFGHSFADCLGRGLFQLAGDDPWQLAQIRVLLPNRRAIRSLSDALVGLNDGRPILLPRMSAIGDVDEEELLLSDDGNGGADLKPAISPLRRRLLLAQLICRRDATISFIQAMRLAAALARFLDEAQIEQADLATLDTIVADQFARHWEETLLFLKIVTKAWPEILDQESRLDPMERRNLLLKAEAQQLTIKPPAFPIIAAGSTGSVPAAANLMKVIAGLAKGYVVLPGLDLNLPLEEQEAIRQDPTHPQHGMLRLLEKLDCPVENVQSWPALPEDPGLPSSRHHLVKAAMLPSSLTGRWRDLAQAQPEINKGWTGIERIDCRTEQEEATIISLLLREALQEPGKQAALITADRQLARRVMAELRYYSITIDDSAGKPLSLSAPGAYLLLLAEAIAADVAPVPLLALLKHPFVQGEMEPGRFRHLSRSLEMAALRGPRPAAGLAGIENVLKAAEKPKTELLAFWTKVSDFFQPLMRQQLDAGTFLDAFLKLAEDLATDRLWSGQEGEAAFRLMMELRDNIAGLPSLRPKEFALLLKDCLQEISIRPLYGQHPRLFIWGPLEARMQRVDRAILGGLNEGSWPRDIAVDPWLNRAMRQSLGLSPAERRIGLSAHDFAQALGNREVFLTRAQRVDGVPSQPSRWLLRFDALSKCLEAPTLVRRDYRSWINALDRPRQFHVLGRPAPKPGANRRPRRLAVTKIETWLADPYAIFAQYILHLKPLAPLDQMPSAAERGMLVHHILSDYVQAGGHGDDLDKEYERLLAIAHASFAPLRTQPGLFAFWVSAFERAARWFVAQWRERRRDILQSYCEVKGEMTVGSGPSAFTLVARADRLDRLKNGHMAIIDYKTGRIVSNKQIERGRAPQLPLEGWMVKEGAFTDLPPGRLIEGLEYWQLKTREQKIIPISAMPEELIEKTREHFLRLLDFYGQEEAIYPASPFSRGWNDYDHLARRGEWGIVAEEENGTDA